MPEAVTNPWTFANWNVTAQGRFIQLYGLVAAQKAAAEAGTTVGGARPPGHQPTIVRHYIISKRVSSGGSGGLVGAGSSGDGPPED